MIYLKTVKGIEDLGIIRNLGQPELQIDLDQGKNGTIWRSCCRCQCSY